MWVTHVYDYNYYLFEMHVSCYLREKNKFYEYEKAHWNIKFYFKICNKKKDLKYNFDKSII